MLTMRSNAIRLDSMKFVSNLPTACFSGGGGTTTPGFVSCKRSYSHKKSRYLLVTVIVGFINAFEVVLVITLYTVWLLAALPTVCGSPTVMENVGLAACSTGCEGCVGLARPSKEVGWTGGGIRGPPLREPSSSMSALRLETAEAAVDGLELMGCLVLEASSFTGGVGALGSSVGSIPKGPNGPIESSRLSRVVDCVRLAWPRPRRALLGAGLTPAAMLGVDLERFAGAGDSAVGLCVSECILSTSPATYELVTMESLQLA